MKKGVSIIIKKEMARFFGDHRLWISTILLPGVLIFVLYSFMGSAFSNLFGSDDAYVPNVYAVNLPASVETMTGDTPMLITEINEAELEEYKTKIEENQDGIDLVLAFSEDFDESVALYSPAMSIVPPNVDIYYNSTSSESSKIYQTFVMLFDSYESSLVNKFDLIHSDLATEKDTTGQMFSSMVPMLLMIFLFSGCMSVAPDSIAGEKERGTISTLLITPVSRSGIAVGKIVSLSIISVLSAASSFIGTFLSLPSLMGGDAVNSNLYSVGDFALLFAVIISTTLFIVGIVSIISAYAKTTKEAASLISPLMIISMLVGITSMFGGGAPANPVYYLVPFYNSVQSMSGILSFSYNPVNLVITVVANLVFCVICVLALRKMFDSERIVFSK